MIKYKENDYPTVGVEQEFHLVDPESADLVQKCGDVIDRIAPDLRYRAAYELFNSVIEWRSEPFRSVHDLEASVREDRLLLRSACELAGALPVASASHPFARWRDQEIVDSDHYKWVLRECVFLAQRLISFGLHVHVGLKSGDAAVYVQNEMRRWLFPMMALSANSPFFEGELTGLASTRMHLFTSMPRTGIPPELASYSELEDLFLKLREAGDVNEPGELWWSMRIQPPLGTLEFRCFDLPTDPRRLAALTALVQAATATCQDLFFEGAAATQMRRELMEQNLWSAMRHGLDRNMIDPATGEVLSTRDQVRKLMDFSSAKADELGTSGYFDDIESILVDGTESEAQVREAETLDGDLVKLELKLAEKTVCKGLA